jgi:hypothetical protein
MSQHSDEVSFRHMLDHASEALEMVQGKNRSDLDNNRMLELSLASNRRNAPPAYTWL